MQLEDIERIPLPELDGEVPAEDQLDALEPLLADPDLVLAYEAAIRLCALGSRIRGMLAS